MFLLRGSRKLSGAHHAPWALPVMHPLTPHCAVGEEWPGQYIYLMSLVWFAKINRINCCIELAYSGASWFGSQLSHPMSLVFCEGVWQLAGREKFWGLWGKLPAWAGFSLSKHWGKLSAMVKIQKFRILSCKIGLPAPLLMNKSAVLWNIGLGFYILIKNLLVSFSEAVLWLISNQILPSPIRQLNNPKWRLMFHYTFISYFIDWNSLVTCRLIFCVK